VVGGTSVQGLKFATLLVVACLAGLTPALAQNRLEKTTTAYRNVDGQAILADVYHPDDDKPCPLIVWFHGGALIMGSREWIIPEIRALAEEKHLCLVSFDYRLAPEAKLPAIISDVDAAFRWLEGEGAQRFHVDPSRMVVAGASAGAYLALVSGYRAPIKPKALVSVSGYGHLDADWYRKPNPYPEFNSRKVSREEAARLSSGPAISNSQESRWPIFLYYRQTGLWPQEVSGFDSTSIAGRIATYEPAKNITPGYPPTLLIHGTEDHDVPYQEAANMAAVLEQNRVPYILKSVGRAGHLLAGGDKAQIDIAYNAMRDFITHYLEAGN
jgi:acetyl esterase/lipase